MSIRFRLATLVFLLGSPAYAAQTPPVEPVDQLMTTARAAIDAQDWSGAISTLLDLVDAAPDNADAYNLLGYASRKSGDPDRAWAFYDAALRINPNHLGALEYQGELFILKGDIAAAEATLVRLAAACGVCAEYADLTAALGDAGS